MARVLEKIDIKLMSIEEADGVAELFRDFYGEEYPVKVFYNPKELIAANQDKSILSVVAQNELGKIVGHAALYHSAPYHKLYEQGAIVVHPDYQGKRTSVKSIALSSLMEVLQVADKMKLAEGIFGETVCNHIHTQKFASRLGNTFETAFELDLMPAEAYDKSGAAKGRVSTFLTFRKGTETKRDVFIPERYKDEIEFLYEPLDLKRDFKAGKLITPNIGSKTACNEQYFEFANTSRIIVNNIGEDFFNYVSLSDNKISEKEGIVFQYWLPLDSPYIDYSINILKENGYFLGGFVPLWNNSDTLLMQKVKNNTDWDSQRIYTPRAKEIVKMVRDDMG